MDSPLSKPILLVSAVALMLLASLAAALWKSSSDVPLLKTPAWQGLELAYGDQLTLRGEGTGNGLLLKRTDSETVYRYDPVHQRLSAVTDRAWHESSEPIAECGKQFSPGPGLLTIDPKSNNLRAKGQVIPTAGNIVLKTTASPSGQWVAVLSAAGQKNESILPFIGGGTSGQRYHEVLSLTESVLVGKSVPIPVAQAGDILNPCWSADERYVVYYPMLFNYVSVVGSEVASTTKLPKVSK